MDEFDGAEWVMSKRQLDDLMWADACRAMERAERLRRQFFHHGRPYWEAPIDVFETADALTILIALPGVELDSITVTLNTGTLVVRGERPLPSELQHARILRMEIPYGRFERRIELPPVPFEISGRHLADGCLMLRLLQQGAIDGVRIYSVARSEAQICRAARRMNCAQSRLPARSGMCSGNMAGLAEDASLEAQTFSTSTRQS